MSPGGWVLTAARGSNVSCRVKLDRREGFQSLGSGGPLSDQVVAQIDGASPMPP